MGECVRAVCQELSMKIMLSWIAAADAVSENYDSNRNRVSGKFVYKIIMKIMKINN